MKKTAKAWIGALVAGLGALGTALLDQDLTPADVGVIVATALAALGFVYQVPNAPSAPPAPSGGHFTAQSGR